MADLRINFNPALIEVVRVSAYLPRNARALMWARQLGGRIKYLSQGEIEARNIPSPPRGGSSERVSTGEEVGLSLGGTDGSNPSPSSEESPFRFRITHPATSGEEMP